MKSKIKPEFSFVKPSVYKIKVNEHLHYNLSEKLGGMQINLTQTKGNGLVTILVGQINDQAALSGILNTLYELHFTIISVNMLLDEI